MVDLLVEGNRVFGVSVSKASGGQHLDSEKLISDAVILAMGHSARDVYDKLLGHNITLTPKDFSVRHLILLNATSSLLVIDSLLYKVKLLSLKPWILISILLVFTRFFDFFVDMEMGGRGFQSLWAKFLILCIFLP